MRVRSIAALATLGLLLSGCEKQAVRDAKAAEQRYELVKKHGTLAEACDAATEVRDAWLKALDQGKYEFAQIDAGLECNAVRLYGGEMPADEKERAKLTVTDMTDMNATMPLPKTAPGDAGSDATDEVSTDGSAGNDNYDVNNDAGE